MRKIILLFCLFLMCGCSSITKIEEDQFVHYEIASNLPALYGGGYRIVETWNGFKVEEITAFSSDGIFKNEDFSIEIKPAGTVQYWTYIYNDGKSTSELYTGLLNQKYDMHPSGVTAFQIEDTVYFTYYHFYDFVVNTIENGMLVEYKRMPLEDDTYRFNAFFHNDNEMYYVYKNDHEMKYVCDEREYIFKKTDRVTLLKDYIFYSTYESNNVTGTYIINRKTNETIQLEENIDLVLDNSHDVYPIIHNERFINNCFVFIENVDGKTIYSYGKIVDDTFEKIELPYELLHEYNYSDEISLYDEKTIFLIQTDSNGNYDYYVIEIK